MEKLIEELEDFNNYTGNILKQWLVSFNNSRPSKEIKTLHFDLIEAYTQMQSRLVEIDEFKKWKDLFENDRSYKTQLSDSSRKISCLLEENAKLNKQLGEVKEKANHLLHLHACEQEGLSSGQPSFMDWMKATSELSEVLTKTEE